MTHLTEDQLECWEKNGYLLLKNYFSTDKFPLDQWVTELSNWPETPGKWMKYFERGANGERQLCRVENFIQYHDGLNSIINSPEIIDILSTLMQEKAILFKEKINMKYPGGSGFIAHQDAPAFTTFNQKYHITMMVSIDKSDKENGCLEVVKGGYHKKGMLPQAEDKTIAPDYEKELHWEAIETEPGDVLFFDSYIPHRSNKNLSNRSRRAMYITYNKVSEGDYREAYYADKRKVFPPECEREEGKDYSNAGVYNVANPIEK